MVIKNGQYIVAISTETTPSLDGYKVIYKSDEVETHDFYCALLIEVEETNGTDFKKIALLDTLISKQDSCAVLEGNILTVILFDTILQIDLNTVTIMRTVHCENCGGLEHILKTNQGYIIKSECEIFCFDKLLNQKWQFYGRDILVRATKEKSFWIENDFIHCRDWSMWHYILDMKGILISEFQEECVN